MEVVSQCTSLHHTMVEWAYEFANLESKTGGSIVTSNVSQAGEIKRVGMRQTEVPRRRKLQYKSPVQIMIDQKKTGQCGVFQLPL